MTGLLLVAASGLAAEVLVVERALARYDSFAVIDDDPRLHGGELAGAPVIGALEEVKRHEDHRIVVCAGRGSVRRSLVARLASVGVGADRFTSVIHPSVEVPAACSVGAGTVLLAGVVLTANVRVGDHVVVMPQVSLTHDDVIESFVTLCAGVSLGGGVRVGEGAYLGMNASVRERVTVGPGSTLGMGAVLLEELPGDETWVGIPARPLRRDTDVGA